MSRTDAEALALLLRSIEQPDLLLPGDEEVPELRGRRGVFCTPDTRELSTALQQERRDDDEISEIVQRLCHEGGSFLVRYAVKAHNADGADDPLLRVTFAGCGCVHFLHLSECRLLSEAPEDTSSEGSVGQL